MNQILVTKKLYITPELKRKKKIYKFDFIISVFFTNLNRNVIFPSVQKGDSMLE